jgi:hypothetical protein
MIVKNKGDRRRIIKEKVDDYCLRRAQARLPSASSAVRRLLLLLAMILGFVLIGEKSLRMAKI